MFLITVLGFLLYNEDKFIKIFNFRIKKFFEIIFLESSEALNKVINCFSDNNSNHIEIVDIIEKENILELLMKDNSDNSDIWKISFDLFTICTFESKQFSQLLINKGIFDFIRKYLQKGYNNVEDMIISLIVKLLMNIIYDCEQGIIESADIFLILIRDFLIKNQISLQTSLNLMELLIKVITRVTIEEEDVLVMTNKVVDVIPKVYNNIEGIDIVAKLLIELVVQNDEVVFSVTTLHDVIVPLFSVLIDNISTTTRPTLYFTLIGIYINKRRN